MALKLRTKKENQNTLNLRVPLTAEKQQSVVNQFNESGKILNEYIKLRQEDRYINPDLMNKSGQYRNALNLYKDAAEILKINGVVEPEKVSFVGDIEKDMDNTKTFFKSFADDYDYQNYKKYGTMTYDELKKEGEKLFKNFPRASEIADYTKEEKTKYFKELSEKEKISSWLSNRMKKKEVMLTKGIEDFQKNASVESEINKKQSAKEKGDFFVSNGVELLETLLFGETRIEKEERELKEEIEKLKSEYVPYFGGEDYAYYDEEGKPVTWNQAIYDKVEYDAENLPLKELEKLYNESQNDLEAATKKFLGFTLPSSKTTEAKKIRDAYKNAYTVKNAETYRENDDFEKNSKSGNYSNQLKDDTLYQIERLDPERAKLLKALYPEEIKLLNYIDNKHGTEKAEEYFAALESKLNKRIYSDQATKIQGYSGWELAGGNALSVLNRIATAIPEAATIAGNYLTNTPIDVYSTDFAGSNYSDLVQQETSNRITENINGAWGDVVNTAYSLGTSTVDMAAAYAVDTVVPGATLILMSSRVGSDTVKDAIKRGVTQDKALATGVAAALFEYIFEKIPLDKFKNFVKKGKKTTAGAIKTILVDGGLSNANEELLTAISNEAADRIINGELSNYEISVKNYIAEGLSEEEARKKASTETAINIGLEGLAGFIQGEIFTAGALTINPIVTKSTGKKIATNNNVNKLVEISSQVEATEDISNAAAEVAGIDAENIISEDYGKIGKLYNKVAETLTAALEKTKKYPQQLTNAFTERLKTLKSKNAEKTAAAITKYLNNETLSSEEQGLLQQPEAQRATSEFDHFGEEGYDNEWVNSAAGEIVENRKKQVQLYEELQSLTESPFATRGANKAQEANIVINQNNENTYTQDENVVTSAVKGIKYDKKQGILVEFESGASVPLKDTELSELNAELIGYAKDYGEYADIFFKTYNLGNNQNIDVFANEFEYAYNSGKIGATLDYVLNSDYTKNITPTQIQNAWEMGRQVSEAEARSESVSTLEEYQANKKAGKVTIDKSISNKTLNRKQVSAIYAMKAIAKATGINIEIVNKGIDNREHNGWYDPNTNTIYIDINAGKLGLGLGEYALLRTLSHELTHYIRENNKAAYKQLQDFIFSKLSDYKGKSIDELVAAEQYENMSFEDAAEEVVARACEMMLRNSAVISALNEENPNLFKTIKNFIHKFKKAVYKAFEKVGARSEAAKAMMQYADELQELWDHALTGAVFNRQGKGNVAKGEQADSQSKVQSGTSGNVKHERAEITKDEVISQSKKAMAAELTRLRELLKMQGKESHGTVFTKTSLEKVASKILKKAESTITKAELMPLLQKFYANIASNKELNFEDVMDEARAIAEKLYSEPRVQKKINAYKQEIKDFIRSKPIYISKQAKLEGEYAYGGAKNFRDAWFGKIKFTTSDTTARPIDSLWKEAVDALGYGDYFSSDITQEPAMAHELIKIYDALSKEDADAELYEVYKDEIVNDIANNIYEGFWDVSTLHTVADRYEKQIMQLRAKHKNQIEKIRNSISAAKIKAIKESREKESAIKIIRNKANVLYDKLLSNNANKHIPETLKEPLGKFLLALDFSTGKGTQSDNEIALKLSNLIIHLQKESINSDGIDVNPQIVEQLESVQKYIEKNTPSNGKFSVRSLSVEQLNTLKRCISEITHSINTLNDFYGNTIKESVRELSNENIEELDKMGVKEKSIGWNMATPYYALKRLGKAGVKIFKNIRQGWEKLAFNSQKILDFTDKTYTKKEARRWSNNVRTYNLSGGKVKMTDATAMYLYIACKRPQALKHLYGSGLKIATFSTSTQKNIAQKEIKFNDSDIKVIENSLNERQKQVAKKLQAFMAFECAAWGNEISMIRYGSKMLTETDYVPIETLEGGKATKESANNSMDIYRLISPSFVKSLNPNAINTLVARNIFEVFTKHATDMAKYNAMALPMLNTIKWLNFQEITPENDVNSVKKSIENAYGKKATEYVIKLLEDINGAKRGNNNLTKKAIKWSLKAQKIAAVAGNLRVAVMQRTSYQRAAKVLSEKSLLGAKIKKLPKFDKVKKYCGMALWKSLGFYDINISHSIEDRILKKTSFISKLIEGSMALTAKADEHTLRRLWNACEIETKKNNPSLKIGSEEFNVAVGDLLSEVIVATQVVDSTITRAQFMRDDDTLTSQLGAFMSEPILSLNVTTDAVNELNKDIQSGMKKTQALKKHSGKILKGFAIYFYQALLVAMIESLADAWRDDEDEEYKDKFLRALPSNVYQNINPLTYGPQGNIINDTIESVIRELVPKEKEEKLEKYIGKDYGNSSLSPYEVIDDTITAIGKWEKVITGESENYYAATSYTAKAISKLTGIPFYNVLREGVYAHNNAMDLLEKDELKLRNYEKPESEKIDNFEYWYNKKEYKKCKKIVDLLIAEDVSKYKKEGLKQEEANKKAYSNIRRSFSNRYKSLYKEAYKDGNANECARIKQILSVANVYENLKEKLQEWKLEAKEEKQAE